MSSVNLLPCSTLQQSSLLEEDKASNYISGSGWASATGDSNLWVTSGPSVHRYYLPTVYTIDFWSASQAHMSWSTNPIDSAPICIKEHLAKSNSTWTK